MRHNMGPVIQCRSATPEDKELHEFAFQRGYDESHELYVADTEQFEQSLAYFKQHKTQATTVWRFNCDNTPLQINTHGLIWTTRAHWRFIPAAQGERLFMIAVKEQSHV